MDRGVALVVCSRQVAAAQATECEQIHSNLPLSPDHVIIDRDESQASAFMGTDLEAILRRQRITRCLVAGLTTEKAVLETVLDAIRAGFAVCVATDAVASIDPTDGAGERALLAMRSAGAILSDAGRIATMTRHYPEPTALLVIDVQEKRFRIGGSPMPGAGGIIAPLRRVLELAQPRTRMVRPRKSAINSASNSRPP